MHKQTDLYKAVEMLKTRISPILSAVLLVVVLCVDSYGSTGSLFRGQDLYLRSETMTVYTDAVERIGKTMILFEGGFTMDIGANSYSSDSAIVRIKTIAPELLSTMNTDYQIDVYLEGNVDVSEKGGAKTSGVENKIVHQGQSLVASFRVTGQIYATADNHKSRLYEDLEQTDIFTHGVTALSPVPSGPQIAYEAQLPQYYIGTEGATEYYAHIDPAEQVAETGHIEGSTEMPAAALEDTKPEYRYPINIAALWEPAPMLESTRTENGQNVATLIGRFYLWQKRDEKGGLLEFQADSAVIFYSGDSFNVNDKSEDVMASGPAESIYLRGNILMTEGPRTIRAEEIYYNFQTHKGLALQSEMRTFDEARSIPVYVRADKLRMMSDTLFSGEDMTVTTSEFFMPQVSLTASKMVLADMAAVDAFGREQDKKYEALLKDIKVKYGETTIFKWGKLRTDFERPDLPIKSIRIGNNSRFGTLVETQWYLARMLGLKEPDGVDSTLLLDYASKRGPATGVNVDYHGKDYFGGISGYIIDDQGEDDLGRLRTRKDLEPDKRLRGRFTARHRHFLQDNWQATLEASYISDQNFLESYFRREFNESKAQETLLHLKRIEDNRALSILAKIRINDYAAETEELPTVAYYVKGESFWNHKLTYYGDNAIGVRRDRIGENGPKITEPFYTYAMSRNEVDMPVLFRSVKIVPYIAGTYALNDLRGFNTNIHDDTIDDKHSNFLGEAGLRFATMFWKDSKVESEFWDLSGLRHTVLPHIEMTIFEGSSKAIAMRDMFNFGVSQRWQTHRGSDDNRRTVDWMRLDADVTLVSNPEGSERGGAYSYGPSRFIWNNQNIPLLTRRSSALYGVVRDSVSADYEWKISDTTSLSGDMVWDIHSSTIQQTNVGITKYVFPDFSVYLGHRYLRNVYFQTDHGPEVGSSAVIAAMTYALNERYMATFSIEHNLEYGGIVRGELSLVRRYHRLYYGLTFSLDKSLDTSSVMFTVWPQGIKEMSMGEGNVTGLSDRVMME